VGQISALKNITISTVESYAHVDEVEEMDSITETKDVPTLDENWEWK
jgi:hypothetical protein